MLPLLLALAPKCKSQQVRRIGTPHLLRILLAKALTALDRAEEAQARLERIKTIEQTIAA